MSNSCQMMCGASLLIALLLGAAGCATTTADGGQEPRTRKVCERVESATGSRMSRRVCRQVEIEPEAEPEAAVEEDVDR